MAPLPPHGMTILPISVLSNVPEDEEKETQFQFASVEIETSMAQSCLARAPTNFIAELMRCIVGDATLDVIVRRSTSVQYFIKWLVYL